MSRRPLKSLSATVLTWLLLSAASEQGDTLVWNGNLWHILDSFPTEKECGAASARVRREAFQALQQIREGRGVPTEITNYKDALWGKPSRDLFIGRSRSICVTQDASP
jgi:hypothetical protein